MADFDPRSSLESAIEIIESLLELLRESMPEEPFLEMIEPVHRALCLIEDYREAFDARIKAAQP